MNTKVVFDADLEQAVRRTAEERVRRTLERRVYNPDDVNAMINLICDDTTQNLARLNENFKFVAHCAVFQRAAPGEPEATFLHENTCFWKADTDGLVQVKWENPSMICLLSVFCLAV